MISRCNEQKNKQTTVVRVLKYTACVESFLCHTIYNLLEVYSEVLDLFWVTVSFTPPALKETRKSM